MKKYILCLVLFLCVNNPVLAGHTITYPSGTKINVGANTQQVQYSCATSGDIDLTWPAGTCFYMTSTDCNYVMISGGNYIAITNNANKTRSTLSMSLVGTGATGTQISATKDADVRFNVTTSTTATIGGASTSNIAIKICATNSATESDWATIDTAGNAQTISLAIILQSAQVVNGFLAAFVPAGWYVKLINSGTGTHSETFVSGDKTIYG